MNSNGNGGDSPKKTTIRVPVAARDLASLFQMEPFRIVAGLAKGSGCAGMNAPLDGSRVRELAKAYQIDVAILSTAGSDRAK